MIQDWVSHYQYTCLRDAYWHDVHNITSLKLGYWSICANMGRGQAHQNRKLLGKQRCKIICLAGQLS